MSHADDRSQTMGQPHTPKVQTTSPKNGKNGLFWVRWSAIWANPGTRQTRPPTTATFPRNTTDKSPPQQHDVSILRLIGHVVSLGFVPCMPWYALLVRTWACYSEPGQPRPRTEQRVNVRNRRPTCETAGSHAGHVGTQVTVAHSQSMTDHGAATHRPAMQHSQERGKHHHLQQQLSHATKPKSHPASNTICPSSTLAPPPTTPTFPHQQAEKSPQNQHVLSCNPKNPTSTSAQAAGGPDCDALGRRQGLAGQRADAPSEARGADGERAGRRPRAHQAAQPR